MFYPRSIPDGMDSPDRFIPWEPKSLSQGLAGIIPESKWRATGETVVELIWAKIEEGDETAANSIFIAEQ